MTDRWTDKWTHGKIMLLSPILTIRVASLVEFSPVVQEEIV